jgi:acyl carrier protein
MTMSSNEIETTVVRFVIDDLGWDGDPATLTGPECVRLPEVLDSQDLLELACFLEDTYEIQIEDSDITNRTFGSVQALGEFVAVKRDHDAA